jgi:hypothetical protein
VARHEQVLRRVPGCNARHSYRIVYRELPLLHPADHPVQESKLAADHNL